LVALFMTSRPVIFAYHAYPWLIHRLAYRRRNHANLHVRGYKEEGTTTTPFDMVMLNDLDRFHLVGDVIDRYPASASVPRGCARRWSTSGCGRERTRARFGDDDPAVRDWTGPGPRWRPDAVS
jgi:xylulose-5-phosphate/fructose-6-phosphate phosphoketolase